MTRLIRFQTTVLYNSYCVESALWNGDSMS